MMKRAKVKNRGPSTTYKIEGDNSREVARQLIESIDDVHVLRVLLEPGATTVEIGFRDQRSQRRTKSLNGELRGNCSSLLARLGYKCDVD